MFMGTSLIPEADHEYIRMLNVDDHSVLCDFDTWNAKFKDNSYISERLKLIEKSLSPTFNRSRLVELYKLEDVTAETKFLATMTWGHEAAAEINSVEPSEAKRDNRGPWKVAKMFADPLVTESVLRSISIQDDSSLLSSYTRLDKSIDRCGPNFFTKHFYFMGKALGSAHYPLILDDRVAAGLVRVISGKSPFSNSIFSMVRISALRKPEAYLRYLKFAQNESQVIGCDMDKIEYYLFQSGKITR